MKRYNITAPKQYTDREGNTKTTYPQIGKLIVWEADGDKKESVTVELFMFPGVAFKAFPDEPRDGQQRGGGNGFKQKVEKTGEEDALAGEFPDEEQIDINDIPF